MNIWGSQRWGVLFPVLSMEKEEIDSKLRSILLIFVIYHSVCDKFSFRIFFQVVWGWINMKGCVLQALNTFS